MTDSPVLVLAAQGFLMCSYACCSSFPIASKVVFLMAIVTLRVLTASLYIVYSCCRTPSINRSACWYEWSLWVGGSTSVVVKRVFFPSVWLVARRGEVGVFSTVISVAFGLGGLKLKVGHESLLGGIAKNFHLATIDRSRADCGQLKRGFSW